ncbi:type II secretion system protein [Campylobacter hominis]
MKAFTMIELIFVIVILGILAAVAIPRLAATRDDAEVVAKSQTIVNGMSEIASFYISQGNFVKGPKGDTDISPMSNIENPVMLRGNACAIFKVTDNNETKLIKGTDGLCANVWSTESLAAIKDTPFSDAIIIIDKK